MQTFVHTDNVALAHLLYEQALISSPEKVSGKKFLMTDPNPAITFGDVYRLLAVLNSFRPIEVPALPMIVLAQLIRMVSPWQGSQSLLSDGCFSKVPGMLSQLQPATLNICKLASVFAQQRSSKGVWEMGAWGIRKGIYTTLEGMCTQMKAWKDSQARRKGGDGILSNIANLLAVHG